MLLIAFSFGAIIEGTSGFGTPVAIAGAVMVGLGFRPSSRAVLNLLANTAPVAFGAPSAPPSSTLAAVSGLDQLTLSPWPGRSFPSSRSWCPSGWWLPSSRCRGKWKDVWEVWPADARLRPFLRHHAVFGVGRRTPLHLMTDVVSGVFSVICTALFLRFVWHPKTRFLLGNVSRAAAAQGGRDHR